jgi:hypothetical protein
METTKNAHVEEEDAEFCISGLFDVDKKSNGYIGVGDILQLDWHGNSTMAQVVSVVEIGGAGRYRMTLRKPKGFKGSWPS